MRGRVRVMSSLRGVPKKQKQSTACITRMLRVRIFLRITQRDHGF